MLHNPTAASDIAHNATDNTLRSRRPRKPHRRQSQTTRNIHRRSFRLIRTPPHHHRHRSLQQDTAPSHTAQSNSHRLPPPREKLLRISGIHKIHDIHAHLADKIHPRQHPQRRQPESIAQIDDVVAAPYSSCPAATQPPATPAPPASSSPPSPARPSAKTAPRIPSRIVGTPSDKNSHCHPRQPVHAIQLQQRSSTAAHPPLPPAKSPS